MNHFFYLVILIAIFYSTFGIHLSVRDEKTKNFCLLFEANITGTLHYTDVHNSSLLRQFKVPENIGETTLDDSSTCGEKLQILSFDFIPLMTPMVPETETNFPWQISLVFNKSDDGYHFMLHQYSLTVFFYSNMNSTEQNVSIPHFYGPAKTSKVDWTASINSSQGPNGYLCSQNDLALNSSDSFLRFNQLKLVAFANQTSPAFNNSQTYQYCVIDARTSDLVPIIVGACLGGLVIIVLVAYLIGRVRAKRQGYNSV